MITIPKNEPRQGGHYGKPKVWIYGSHYVGKTRFADEFPNNLILNTDGNAVHCKSQIIDIRASNEMVGRTPKTTTSWTKFKEVLTLLESNPDTGYEYITIDLIDDLYESCRVTKCKELGITHESDDTFRAWEKVRAEFSQGIDRLLVLPYGIILISHESISKEYTGRSGDKISRISPSIHDAVILTIASKVDITARATSDGITKELMVKPSSDVIIGGTRLKCRTPTIPLKYDEIIKLYKEQEIQ